MLGISTTTSALTILCDQRAGSRHQDALIIVTVSCGVLEQGARSRRGGNTADGAAMVRSCRIGGWAVGHHDRSSRKVRVVGSSDDDSEDREYHEEIYCSSSFFCLCLFLPRVERSSGQNVGSGCHWLHGSMASKSPPARQIPGSWPGFNGLISVCTHCVQNI